MTTNFFSPKSHGLIQEPGVPLAVPGQRPPQDIAPQEGIAPSSKVSFVEEHAPTDEAFVDVAHLVAKVVAETYVNTTAPGDVYALQVARRKTAISALAHQVRSMRFLYDIAKRQEAHSLPKSSK